MNNLASQMLWIIKVFTQHVILCNTHTSKLGEAMSVLPGMAPHIRSGKVINISPTHFTSVPQKHSCKNQSLIRSHSHRASVGNDYTISFLISLQTQCRKCCFPDTPWSTLHTTSMKHPVFESGA